MEVNPMRSKIMLTLLLSMVLALMFSITAQGYIFSSTPALQTITPEKGITGTSVTVTLSGAKFEKKATVRLVMDGQADILPTDLQVVSKNEIRCTFDLKDKVTGKWSVVVANTAKKFAKLAAGFTIEYPDPQISSIDPAQASNEGPLVISSLSGANFRFGATVTLRKSEQQDVQATRVALFSSSELTCEFDLTDVTPGAYDLIVANDDGKTATLKAGFNVELFIPEPEVTEETEVAAEDEAVAEDEATSDEEVVADDEAAADEEVVAED